MTITAQLRDRVKRDGESEMHRVREPRENNELLKACDTVEERGSLTVGLGAGGRGEGRCRQTAFINSICLCKRV